MKVRHERSSHFKMPSLEVVEAALKQGVALTIEQIQEKTGFKDSYIRVLLSSLCRQGRAHISVIRDEIRNKTISGIRLYSAGKSNKPPKRIEIDLQDLRNKKITDEKAATIELVEALISEGVCTSKEIAQRVGLSEGYVSSIIRYLTEIDVVHLARVEKYGLKIWAKGKKPPEQQISIINETSSKPKAYIAFNPDTRNSTETVFFNATKDAIARRALSATKA